METFWNNLPFILIFLLAAILLGFHLRNAHREKMEYLKRGELPFLPADWIEQLKYRNLSRGVLALSLALGIFSAQAMIGSGTMQPAVAYISMCLLWFGIGSLAFYLFIRKR